MKKVMLIIMIMGTLIISNAQTDCDYNPYSYKEKQAAQKRISIEGYQELIAKECDTSLLRTSIERYNSTKDVIPESIFDLYTIAGCNCPEIIDFAIDLIVNSPDKEARKFAIGMLGFRKNYNAIPLLLNHVKKDISPDEKIIVAITLAALDRKTEALEILNGNCYALDDMNNDCILCYVIFFDQLTAINYFEYYFNKPETQLEAACWLAMCGVSDKTFPLFVEFLKNNTTYERGTSYSLVGLAAIGTEEALEIIRQQTKNNTYLIARSATLIFDRLMKERSEK